jgi:ATP-dependent DNA helicase PIF1
LTKTSYNIDESLTFVQSNKYKLADYQRMVYNIVLNNISQNSGQLFILDVPGGTGKTVVLNLLLSKLRMQQKLALVVA